MANGVQSQQDSACPTSQSDVSSGAACYATHIMSFCAAWLAAAIGACCCWCCTSCVLNMELCRHTCQVVEDLVLTHIMTLGLSSIVLLNILYADCPDQEESDFLFRCLQDEPSLLPNMPRQGVPYDLVDQSEGGAVQELLAKLQAGGLS